MTNFNGCWPEVAVGDLCEFRYGKSLPDSARLSGSVPVFGSNGRVGWHDQAITNGETIIVGRKGSFGEVNFSEKSCWPIDTTYYVDSSATKADLRWLYYRLRSLGLNKLNRAAAVPGLNREDAYRKRILLPSLSEQSRIAAILDKADALRAKRRAAIEKLDTLTQSIFLDMFGDPMANPRKWPVELLGHICSVRGGKRLPNGEEYSSYPTPFRYIRVTDFRSGHVDESALVYLKPEVQSRIARYIVNAGDIVISIAGSIGLLATVGKNLNGANLTENAAKLVAKRPEIYDPAFLTAYLRSKYAQSQIDSHIGQVTIGKLALFRIEKIKVTLPPISLQRDFSKRLSAVEKIRSTYAKSVSELDGLFASLLHRAFRGDLTAGDASRAA